MSSADDPSAPIIDPHSEALDGGVAMTVGDVADSPHDSGVIRIDHLTRHSDNGLLRVGGNTYEVSLNTCKDVLHAMQGVEHTGGSTVIRITGDLLDLAFLVGPGCDVVVETGPGVI